MRKMLSYPAVRIICWYLVLTFSGFFILPAVAQAAFISPSEGVLSGMDIDAVQRARAALENNVIEEKLVALGLSSDEIRARLDGLTSEERQAVLEDVDRIQAGGNGVVTLLIVVLLVVLIIKLLDKEIIIK